MNKASELQAKKSNVCYVSKASIYQVGKLSKHQVNKVSARYAKWIPVDKINKTSIASQF